MRERVFLRIGQKPVIIVSPHGADDTHTATIAKETAKIVDGFAVVNQGFERAATVDEAKDKANCNRIDHLNEPVVFDEFLKPLIKYKDIARAKILGQRLNQPHWFSPSTIGTTHRVLIFHIHGAGNIVHQQANEPVEVIVGWGLGKKKNSLTCQEWRKNLFVDSYRQIANEGDVFEASGGSNYAGRSSNNLNQFFRKHQSDPCVESMQLEFPFSSRTTKKAAVATAAKLALVIGEVLSRSSYLNQPTPKFI